MHFIIFSLNKKIDNLKVFYNFKNFKFSINFNNKNIKKLNVLYKIKSNTLLFM